MNTVELLNVNNPEHAGFVYDLTEACKEDFCDDYHQDRVLIIEQLQPNVAFICQIEGENIGLVWVEVDACENGCLRLGVLPAYREQFQPQYFLEEFIRFCFNKLHLRTLHARFTPDNNDYEALLRCCGFKKQGQFPEEIVKDGLPRDIIRIGLTRTKYELMETQAHGH